MNLIIDAHQDLAYSGLAYGRNYHLSSGEIRAQESRNKFVASPGQSVLGYPDFQKGAVAIIFSTLFVSPYAYREWDDELICYKNPADAHNWFQKEIDYYRELCDSPLDHFSIIQSKHGLNDLLGNWRKTPISYPETAHPVGLVLLLEGAEGIGNVDEMEEYWEKGVRIVGPVWAGTRFCGGTYKNGSFTPEGYALLEIMGDLGMILDIAHMNDKSARQAIDTYQGGIIASHANSRTVLHGELGERHLTDEVIRGLTERDGVIGVIPGNSFLKPGWKTDDDRSLVSLDHLIAHIDFICQICGDAKHVGIGTDFDGGFGYPAIPEEMDTIADLQKLDPLLAERGYQPQDIEAILGGNFQRILEAYLPER